MKSLQSPRGTAIKSAANVVSKGIASFRRCRLMRASERQEASTTDAATSTSTPPRTEAQPAVQPAAEAPSKSAGPGIAAGAVLAAVAAFTASNLLVSGPTLATLESMAVPLDQALHNGKPTVLEFYADWCEVCKSLVPYEYELQKQYSDRVNFVLLNVENSRWAQEAAEFRVNGIPHFVFLDSQGTPLAAAVGRIPQQVLEGNLESLARGQQQLPYAATRAATSPMTPPDGVAAPRQAAPRDHA